MAERLEDYALGKRATNTKGTIKKVGLVGGGSMGQEIAVEVSKAGIDVILIDLNPDRIEEIKGMISNLLDIRINRWGMTTGDKKAILSRIQFSTDFCDLVDSNIVIECINTKKSVSNIESRKEVFKSIEKCVGEDTVIASNASTVLIADLAIVLNHPERSIGIHFISPASSVDIIEVNKCVITNQVTSDIIEKFAKVIKKKIIHVTASPGNISTRLIIPLINEACELLMEGVGTVEDIDNTLMLGFGMQLGPFALADKIGLDKLLKWMEGLYDEFGDKKYKTSPIIKRMVRANLMGKRTGEGFYIYENEKRRSKAGSIINLGREI
ncbi:MAG: 3-hydroxyacyl-CoA dehydrogenase family protein [Bacteroidetes bacterium]|nr:3-hydroxyacyl-CoA dehydrogenase family protein [Bacteroidota bacterium]MBT3934440.1 3-hydroxyacyl-CoA dehydrogenase family protein [Bacteroidota bacterium]MBT4727495.1 3-hydroxyacyl-CoA dehydrogenase family protein [Bacteroidota bacterium]MBT4968810.1 3-hydroxyacyl-CoA dehydrogenase family protein [Bacteroidota bacterium]MBT5992342.1 3-hydroxyacyl-CoA dehydrogenase family protein [Bacteroidota bacterium]